MSETAKPIDDGGPAFFDVSIVKLHGHSMPIVVNGPSRRDVIAESAMVGFLASNGIRCISGLIRDSDEGGRMSEEEIADAANFQVARCSYRLADAMLLARKAPQ